MMFGRLIITTLLLAANAYANIIFSWVQPECIHNTTDGHQGCLREQYCREDNTYVFFTCEHKTPADG